MSKVDLKNSKKEAELQLLTACRQRTFVSNSQKLDDFTESDMWKKLHKQPHVHDLLFEYATSLFGKDNVSIYDDGNVTHGHSFHGKLSDEHKALIIDVDSNKKVGIHTLNGLHVKHIGSTVAFNHPGNSLLGQKMG